MTDYDDLIQRLLSWTETGIKDAAVRAEAAVAIKELVAERDEAERLAFDIDGSRRLLEGRLARAEADLAAARKALEALACLGNGDRPGNSEGNVIAQRALAAIAAAQADGGKNDSE